ncbi:MAG TPA: hypothetical protein VNN74_06770 [Candidatus Micrarchaeia archaeon]|nr:hypothetical protein [Candidatus Micrarchaeia archaeon]
MISDDDVVAVARAAEKLGPARRDYTDFDFGTALSLTAIDFNMKTPQVAKAARHYDDRWRRELRTLDDFDALFSKYPETKEGNDELAVALWGYHRWDRAWLLRLFVAFLRKANIGDLLDLRAWVAKADYDTDFKGRVQFKRNGYTFSFAEGVFRWLALRQGVATVKPDVHVHRFVKGALGRAVSNAEAVGVVSRAAERLRRPWTAHELDNAIWEAGVGIDA